MRPNYIHQRIGVSSNYFGQKGFKISARSRQELLDLRSKVNFHGGNMGTIKIDQLAMINYAFLLSWLRSFCKTQALTFNNPFSEQKAKRMKKIIFT